MDRRDGELQKKSIRDHVLTVHQIQKLQTALHDYEQEKWRIVAQKVGTGFTSTACKEKAEELAGGVVHHGEDDEGGDDQS